MGFDEHPTVKWYRAQERDLKESAPLDADELRALCREAGADDAGFVEIDRVDRPGLTEEKESLLNALPGTKTVISLAFRANREALRTAVHSVTNLEFRHLWDHANRTGRKIVSALGGRGIRALNAPAGFPYETEAWPGRMWFASDKTIAVAAGLGQMGLNRMVLHPRFGDALVLGTVLVDCTLTAYSAPLDFNPCIRCGLCGAVCPVGAISADGRFDFFSCFTHNYRERLGGFSDWVERLAASRSAKDYRRRVSDVETVSMWQNLSITGQTKCDRCMAVCPAGEEAIGEFLSDRKGYAERTVNRMREKTETVYVVPGSDAEAYTAAHFPHKTLRRVANGIRTPSAASFLKSLPLVFQWGRSDGLAATYHFTFTGEERCTGTVVIKDRKVSVQSGHEGIPDLGIIADSRTWIRFLAKETPILPAIITGKIRVKGPLRLMKAFARCFPS